MLSRLPGSSKNRRRRISHLGQSTLKLDLVDRELAGLLDSTLVGVAPKTIAVALTNAQPPCTRDEDLLSFSQQLPDCATGGTFQHGYFLQSEVGQYICTTIILRF